MRSPLQTPLRCDLTDRITQMPALEAAVKAGTATLSDPYALALVSCCKHDDVLCCHRELLTRSGTQASHSTRPLPARSTPPGPWWP